MPTATPMQIIAACDAGSEAMVALGLPRPANLADVIRTMWGAQDQLSESAQRQLAKRDRMMLNYAYSATKVPGAAPKMLSLPFPAT